jgi:hypothetical protein
MNEEIKIKFNSENACYHLAQNLLASIMLSKAQRLNYVNVNLLVAFYTGGGGCETCSFTLTGEHWLRVFEIKKPRKISGHKRMR